MAAYTMYRSQSPVPPTEPPGRARILECGDCLGAGCDYCKDTGGELWNACPRCGDPAFHFVNGRNEGGGMICRLSCGYLWDAEDPGWLLQVMPAVSALHPPPSVHQPGNT